MGFLIDSNTLIDYLSNKLPLNCMVFMNEVVNATPLLSVITVIEVLGYNSPKPAEVLLKDFIDASIVIPLSEQVINATIEIRKMRKIKTPDAIIAASAVVSNLSLITRNINDFAGVGLIDIIDSWKI